MSKRWSKSGRLYVQMHTVMCCVSSSSRWLELGSFAGARCLLSYTPGITRRGDARVARALKTRSVVALARLAQLDQV